MKLISILNQYTPGNVCCWVELEVPDEAIGSVPPSPPPNRGDMWLRETCSMKDVPYFLKYHHSKI